MSEKDVISPITGSVWKLLCREGQSVAEGDELMILESMKMEFPVTADASGTITALGIVEGDAVDEDAVLCRIAEG